MYTYIYICIDNIRASVLDKPTIISDIFSWRSQAFPGSSRKPWGFDVPNFDGAFDGSMDQPFMETDVGHLTEGMVWKFRTAIVVINPTSSSRSNSSSVSDETEKEGGGEGVIP